MSGEDEGVSLDEFHALPESEPQVEGGISVNEFENLPPPPATDQGIAGDIAAGLRGVRQGIPGAREIATGVESWRKGVPFAEEYAHQQERDRQLAAEHPKMHLAGELAGAFVPIVPGTSAASLAAKAENAIASRYGKTAGAAGAGALFGAVQGAGEGVTPEEKAQNALNAAKWGGIGGAALGNIASRLPATEAEAAMERLAEQTGVSPSIPGSIAAEGGAAQTTADILRRVPWTQGTLKAAEEKGVKNLGEAVEKMPGITNPKLSMEQAGRPAADSLRDWITTRSHAIEDPYYNNLRSILNPNTTTPLTNTQKVINDLVRERDTAAMGPSSTLSKEINELANAPGGLTFEGIKRRRSEIGRQNTGIITESDLDSTTLDRLYGAYTKDLEAAAQNAGGAQGVAAFRQANDMSKHLYEGRKRLGLLVGKKGDVLDSDVFKRLSKAAKQGGEATLLRDARMAMDPAAWNDVASGIVADLGHAGDKFDVANFVKNYGKLSDDGRNEIFGPRGSALRNAIEDVYTVANRYKDRGKSAPMAGIGLLLGEAAKVAVGLGLYTAPGSTLGVTTGIGLGTLGAARVLSNPRLLRPFARRVEQYMRNPTPAMLQQARNALAADLSALAARPRGSVTYAPIAAQDQREERASGGKVGKRDYPAKRLSRMEKAILRAQKAIAEESKPLIQMPDAHVAHALEIAKDK